MGKLMPDDDQTLTVLQIRKALCEECAAGQPYVDAEGWFPNMFHDWPDGGRGSRVKCHAFEVVRRIRSNLP